LKAADLENLLSKPFWGEVENYHPEIETMYVNLTVNPAPLPHNPLVRLPFHRALRPTSANPMKNLLANLALYGDSKKGGEGGQNFSRWLGVANPVAEK